MEADVAVSLCNGKGVFRGEERGRTDLSLGILGPRRAQAKLAQLLLRLRGERV